MKRVPRLQEASQFSVTADLRNRITRPVVANGHELETRQMRTDVTSANVRLLAAAPAMYDELLEQARFLSHILATMPESPLCRPALKRFEQIKLLMDKTHVSHGETS